jgi:hypothetical protein
MYSVKLSHGETQMKKFSLLSLFLLILSITVMAAPAAAEELPSSTGCEAMGTGSMAADTVITFPADAYDAGDTITLTVTGPGDTYALMQNGFIVKQTDVGTGISYLISQSGTYEFSIEVYGSPTPNTLADYACTPVSEMTGKVAVCHMPPGNPDNAHTIRVGASALTAHLKHGDTIGECPAGVDSRYDNAQAGVVMFIFEGDETIEFWGDCVEDECQQILVIDLNDLNLEETEFLFEPEVSESMYVIIYYLQQSHLDDTFAVFQVNIYSGEGALLDDSVLIFMNGEGEITGWMLRQDYDLMSELPGYIYD